MSELSLALKWVRRESSEIQRGSRAYRTGQTIQVQVEDNEKDPHMQLRHHVQRGLEYIVLTKPVIVYMTSLPFPAH